MTAEALRDGDTGCNIKEYRQAQADKKQGTALTLETLWL